jgi:hypothetical protein
MKTPLFILLLLGTTTLTSCIKSPDFPLNQREGSYYQSFSWDFQNERYSLELGIPTYIYDYYHRLPKQIPPQCFVEENYRYEYLDYVAEYFEGKAREKHFSRRQTAQFILNFCQSIPYYDDPDVGYDWFRWPCETLMEKRQDCEDISILYVSILSRMKYKTCLVLLPGHMAAGIMVQPDGDYYYQGNVGRYSFAECTNAGWRLGVLSVPQDSAIIFEIPPSYPVAYTKLKKYSSTLSQTHLKAKP